MPLFFPRGWRVALVKTDEAAQSTPSLGNDVLRSASAPGDTWLSEHIPLAAIHTPLILTYTLGETSTLFTGFTPSVLSPLCFSFCPLPASCDAVLHSSFFPLVLICLCSFPKHFPVILIHLFGKKGLSSNATSF